MYARACMGYCCQAMLKSTQGDLLEAHTIWIEIRVRDLDKDPFFCIPSKAPNEESVHRQHILAKPVRVSRLQMTYTFLSSEIMSLVVGLSQANDKVKYGVNCASEKLICVIRKPLYPFTHYPNVS